jgi:hypothetical protein
MEFSLYCFETAIPYKKKIERKVENKNLLSMGLINSSKKMRWLNSLKIGLSLKVRPCGT